jgi:hypothetical protein
MKTILTICMIFIGLNMQAQYSVVDSAQTREIQSMKIKMKRSKVAFAGAGVAIMAGSIMMYNNAVSRPPDPSKYTNSPEQYISDKTNYDNHQKRNQKATAGLYTLAGLLMVVGVGISF